MKGNRRILGLVLMFLFASANASLIERGDGFIYDDVLDITWTQDASINGSKNWYDQVAWVNDFSLTHSDYGTFDDWRLPNMDVNGDGDVVNCRSQLASELDCRDNELGYLYHQYGITPFSQGVFNGVVRDNYWSGTERGLFNEATYGIAFRENDGGVIGTVKTSINPTWAVRDGDVAATVVPIPAAVWLFGAALVGLASFRRRSILRLR